MCALFVCIYLLYVILTHLVFVLHYLCSLWFVSKYCTLLLLRLAKDSHQTISCCHPWPSRQTLADENQQISETSWKNSFYHYLDVMHNYRRMMVPRRHMPNCQQLATLPRKHFTTIENIEAATLMTTRRYKNIDEFQDEINNKIQSFMCGKSLLKM